MSFSDFNKIFFPTEEEIKLQEQKLKEILNQCIDDRKNVKLVLTKDLFLYKREPFSSFLGDCTYCSNYLDSNIGFCEGGWCKLHRITCGWGFTCSDNDSEWTVL